MALTDGRYTPSNGLATAFERILFSGGPGALVPGVIFAVILLETSEFLWLLHFKVPLVPFAVGHGVFQRGKLDDSVRERIARRTPTHQTIFPSSGKETRTRRMNDGENYNTPIQLTRS